MEPVRPPAGAASNGLLLMWITRNITARTLIWLAAVTVPVQGLPAPSCGCTGGEACCKQQHVRGCCCSARKVRERCCCCASLQAGAGSSCCSEAESGQDSSCNCGLDCQCGKATQQEPATPPVEDNQTEKVVGDSLTTTTRATFGQPQTTRRREYESAGVVAVTALDRCTSLCRFTL